MSRLVTGPATPAAGRRRALRAAVLLLVLAALAVAARRADVQPADLRRAVRQAGAWGPVLFVSGYVLLTLTPLSKGLLTAAGGAVFGFWPGLGLALLAATSGALLAFAVARRFGPRLVVRRTGRWHARAADLLQDRGLVAVLGARLVPVVPFTALNYLAGLSTVRVRDYLLGTAVGIVPGTAAYTAAGAFGTAALTSVGATWAVAVAAVAVVAGSAHLVRRGQR